MTNQCGERATTIIVGTERVLSAGDWRTIEFLACPVTWGPHPEQIVLPGADTKTGARRWIGCGMG